jgi:hypothetical protein
VLHHHLDATAGLIVHHKSPHGLTVQHMYTTFKVVLVVNATTTTWLIISQHNSAKQQSRQHFAYEHPDATCATAKVTANSKNSSLHGIALLAGTADSNRKNAHCSGPEDSLAKTVQYGTTSTMRVEQVRFFYGLKQQSIYLHTLLRVGALQPQ